MPFYEYECSNCKFYVEALQKISDPPLRKCPSCKKQTLKRLVSAPVFRLKGGGWYETDFKSDQEGKRNLAEGEEAARPSRTTRPTRRQGREAGRKPRQGSRQEARGRAARKPRDAARAKPRRAAKSKSKPKAKPKAPSAAARARRWRGKRQSLHGLAGRP